LRSLPTTQDLLIWKWRGAAPLDPTAFGDPQIDSSYRLCIYDRVAGDYRIAQELDAIAGASCNSLSCWTPTSSGYRYDNEGWEQGAIRSMALAGGGHGQISVRGGGLRASLPSLPLAKAPSVKVQLVESQTSRCWEADYSAATQNDSAHFSARSD
jgi:hypothetical protein